MYVVSWSARFIRAWKGTTERGGGTEAGGGDGDGL